MLDFSIYLDNRVRKVKLAPRGYGKAVFVAQCLSKVNDETYWILQKGYQLTLTCKPIELFKFYKEGYILIATTIDGRTKELF